MFTINFNIFLAVVIVAISGCATTQEECTQTNWALQGHGDAFRGDQKDKKLQFWKNRCSQYTTVDDDAYLSGYQRGIKEYCTPQKIYSSASWRNTAHLEFCPDKLKPSLIKARNDGKHVLHLKDQLREIDNKYSSIKAGAKNVNNDQRLDALDRERREIQREISKIDVQYKQ